jgi:hypothetical protein
MKKQTYTGIYVVLKATGQALCWMPMVDYVLLGKPDWAGWQTVMWIKVGDKVEVLRRCGENNVYLLVNDSQVVSLPTYFLDDCCRPIPEGMLTKALYF